MERENKKEQVRMTESEKADFRMIVRHLLRICSRKPIGNNSEEHAAILISELIRSATVSIDIFCWRFNDDVWAQPEVLSALRNAICKSEKITIRAVTQEEPADNECTQMLRKAGVEIKRAVRSDIEANLILIDGRAFRYEPKKNDRHGIAYAENPDLAKDVKSIFDAVYPNEN